ncbi:endolytic transglycosylase MltG [Maritimibacter sp. DP07]|uniref:Endolytic murein transglycosylase n=1 Tax=Maritimibacter harenae TaxID=2606218 RepID=A0A845LZX6_9RHOB|nr:endolytic transglycosylase MltG [Maritimibacter harenae]MZR13345.1 endolytic transglycosylase MltG [Maritimibacter harenae]
MWKNIASNALSLSIIALVVIAGVIGWGKRQYEAEGPLETAICLRVEQGSNFTRVSEALETQGAIDSTAIFRMGAEYSGKSTELKAGSFLVEEHASMRQIVDIVTRGGASTCGTEVVYRIGINAAEYRVRELDPATQTFLVVAEFTPEDDVPAEYARVRDLADTRYRVAIAEGATSWQIVDALRKAEFLSGEIAAQPAEGSLAPDSYELRPGDDRAELIDRMQTKQDERLATAWENRAEGLPYESPGEALIMASIIEKETGQPEERPQVASVFVNRLEQGMRLQTDPTVIYGITNGQGVLGRGIRQSELRADTPYNTYVISGLPPTPIANPGLASIEAALNPAETDYLFFVADGSGGHAFAKTLEEHTRNVSRWREIEAQRASE